LARLDGALDQVVDQALELGARQLHRQVLRPGGVGGDEGQVDLGLCRGRQLDLGLLRGLLEALEGELVVAQVDALLLLELVGEIADQAHVEVLAAEERVAVGRRDLEHAGADFEHGDVERTAAQVVDRDRSGRLLVEAVGERGGGRLVDDAQHLQAGDLAGVLGGLPLGVVEIGRNGDDGLLDLLAEIALGRFLHLLKDHRGDLRRRIGFALGFDPGVAVAVLHDLVGNEFLVLLDHRVVVAPADQTLDREEGVLRVGDRLSLGRLADEALVRIGKSHDRRRGAGAFRVLDHPAILAVHHSDAGIGRTEVDADYFCHVLLSAKQAFKDPIPAFRRKPPFARNFASARRAPRHALVAAYIRSTNFGCKSPASPLRLPARAIRDGHCDPAPCHRHPAKGHIGLASGKRRASGVAGWRGWLPELRRIRVRTPAVVLALVLFTVIFAVAGLFVWQGYRDALVRGEQRAAIAAHTIAAHFQWIIEASRQALRRTDDTLGFRPQIWNHDGTGDISDAVAGLPETVDVRVFDAAGEEVLTTRPQAGELSVGDRPYFQELKSGRRLIVSRLLVDRVTGDASFVVAQRLEREGGFAGIAAIVIPSSLIS